MIGNPGGAASGWDDSSALVPKSVLDSFLGIDNGIRYITNTTGAKIRPTLHVGGRIMSAFVQRCIF